MITENVYLWSVLTAGILSFFSPCILPMLPVYFSFLGSSEAGRLSEPSDSASFRPNFRLIRHTLLFILGLAVVFLLLGFGAGALGSVINSSWFMIACGAIVIGFGIQQTGFIQLAFMEKEKRLQLGSGKQRGAWGAFLLGLTFSFGWTPCIGPVLAAILGLSASGGSAAYGVWMMFIYTIGMAIPFLVLAVFSDMLLRHLRKLYRYTPVIKVVSGVILIVMGVLLMTNNLAIITATFNF